MAERARVTSGELPASSSLWAMHGTGDFLDCYVIASDLAPREAAVRGLRMPAWAMALLRLRNALVRPFGLRTEAPPDEDSIGMFPVVRDDEREFVLGFDDRHLDFRIGILREGGRIHASTWVRPHNLWGRAYLWLVMPFHVLILRGAVARMAG